LLDLHLLRARDFKKPDPAVSCGPATQIGQDPMPAIRQLQKHSRSLHQTMAKIVALR
jgi:hypothetical protein